MLSLRCWITWHVSPPTYRAVTGYRIWWDGPMPFPHDATLADAGEFGLIAELVALFPQGEHVLIGPGDDAAVLRVRNGHVVVSTDLMVEGRHFRRDWASAEDVGHRAAAQNLSDINAMGGRATSLTVGLAAPADLPVQWALDFARGFAEECELVGASVVGGDLTRADQVVIAVTVLGACTQAPVVRSGARAGDVARALRSPGLGGRRAGRARPRVPVAAGPRGGLPSPGAAVRRRRGGRRGRRHRDDRRLRRAARRRRPRRRARPGSRSTCTPRRSRSPSRCRPSAPPSEPTRCSSSWAAETTTRCWRRSPTRPRCPRAGR